MRSGARRARLIGPALLLAGLGSSAAGALEIAAPAATAGAANSYGPGDGGQNPSGHWGGAYVLQGVPGYGYCIQPGDADPVELPYTQWSPVPYPGSSSFTNGQMAALAYFAERYQSTGFDGYSVNDTVASIAQVAYLSAGGQTPPSSRGPAWLVSDLEAWMTTYAAPWTVTLTMSPPSGSVFTTHTNYSGTITVRSATGAGIGGLHLIAPATGGAPAGQVSNFVWLQPSTNSAGSIGFQWNINGVPAGGTFLAGGIRIVDGVPATQPPTFAAPAGSNGQRMLVSGASTGPTLQFSGTARQAPQPMGTISIAKAVPDGAYFGPGGAVFQIRNGAGQIVDNLVTNAQGRTPYSIPLPASSGGVAYSVHEAVAPDGYARAPDQVVHVFPNQDTVADYSGAYEEPVRSAQLGARKLDAQTGQPLAGAVFDFAFDSKNDGAYDIDLGRCTTGGSGTCHPPDRNAPGGWLPGRYRVTEVQAPPGYWRDPASAVQTVFLQPGASSATSVTFDDVALGSVQLHKSGNDTAYWAVSGARFTVTGPAPSATDVGNLVVGPNGTSNVLTSLTPGTYRITETSAPTGYEPVAPFTAAVAAGHAITEVSATDPVQPATLVIRKKDATTGDPLAGATFDTRFDSHDDGVFDADLGTCTTDATGTCAPPPNDGAGFLPGRYRVTEVAAPPGYVAATPNASKVVVVAPSASASFSFTDRKLVAASFAKVATGNYDPSLLVLSGAVIDVAAGTTYGGPVVATCTTDAAGRCTTDKVLQSGEPYCWEETASPPGLAPGATGCFTATNSLATLPVTVTDPGTFVAVAAKKVDAAAPSVALPGAVLDLYRKDGGHGPSSPAAPGDALPEPTQTWVARATTGSGGTATFALQFPGYAYCVVERSAPPNYVTDGTEHCTAVLSGSTATPPTVTTVTVPDTEATVTLAAHKYNSATPGTAIPGAAYDLYVEGKGPPSGPPTPPPRGVAHEPGATWWGRGTTSGSGRLAFRVPAGYSWCLREVSAPTDYVLDRALHCTAPLDAAVPVPRFVVALPETTALVEVYAHKFNAARPATTIPGATYELVGRGPTPAGWSAPSNPARLPVPQGDWYVGTATTGRDGYASWTVPAGHSWCLHEVSAPAGYRLDTGWHCTSVVTTATSPRRATVALPEIAVPGPVTAAATSTPAPELPFTGGPGADQVLGGLVLGAAGGALMLVARRRARRATSAGGGGGGPR